MLGNMTYGIFLSVFLNKISVQLLVQHAFINITLSQNIKTQYHFRMSTSKNILIVSREF